MDSSPPEKLFSEIQSLLRRGSASLLLAFGLAAAPSVSSGETRAEAPLFPLVTVDNKLPEEEWERRNQIRKTLLAAAARKYGPHSDGAIMSYSGDLANLKHRVNALMSGNASAPKVVIIDPYKIDMGMAFGLSAQDSVSAFLKKEGAKVEEMTLIDIQKTLHTGVTTPDGIRAHTANPRIFPDARAGDGPACIIVPSSDHLPIFGIKGLSLEEETRFVNLHEAWHCMDTHYKLTPEEHDILKGLGNLRDHPSSPSLSRAISTAYNQEALADVGGMGDFIREGGSAGLIAHLRVAREGRAEDLLHLSSPALALLEKRVEEMGLDRFRKLDDASAKALYLEIVDQEGLSPARAEVVHGYLSGGPLRRLGYHIEGLSSPDTAKAIRLVSLVLAAEASAEMEMQPPPETKQKPRSDWSAPAALLDHAFAVSGRITPTTLTEAYARLQHYIHGQRMDYPHSSLPVIWADDLKTSYKMIWLIDYVEVNAMRGVDIEKAEPELFAASKSPPAPATAAPAR